MINGLSVTEEGSVRDFNHIVTVIVDTNRRFHSLTRASVRGARLHRPPRRPVAAAAEEAG
jgi:hypothetical protein